MTLRAVTPSSPPRSSRRRGPPKLYKDNAPVGGSRGNEDTATTLTCTTGADGTCTITNIPQGEYWVVETKTPANHDTAADQHATVAPDTTVELTFVNPPEALQNLSRLYGVETLLPLKA